MQFQTMSTVWGLMIDGGVITNNTLNYCLKLLVSMLKQPSNSRYYRFGIDVLERCKMRLKDYVTFCQWILQLPNFQQFPRVLRDFIDYGARGIFYSLLELDVHISFFLIQICYFSRYPPTKPESKPVPISHPEHEPIQPQQHPALRRQSNKPLAHLLHQQLPSQQVLKRPTGQFGIQPAKSVEYREFANWFQPCQVCRW